MISQLTIFIVSNVLFFEVHNKIICFKLFIQTISQKEHILIGNDKTQVQKEKMQFEKGILTNFPLCGIIHMLAEGILNE